MATVRAELVSVPFREDTIQAVRDPTGKIMVGVKRICESLGLGYGSQLQKLKGHHWSGVTMIVTPDSRDREQETCVIPLDRLPMWLATIDGRKVGGEVREKLAAYQTEAAGTLARHFFGQPEPEPTGIDLQIRQVKELVSILERQAEQEKRLATVEAKAIEASTKADQALAIVTGETGFMTVKGFCNVRKIKLPEGGMAKAGKAISGFCRAHSIEIRRVGSEKWGFENIYPVEILEKWLEWERDKVRSN